MKTLLNNIDNNCVSDYNFSQMGFYKPYKDATNKIDLMRYTNNCLSYGYNRSENKFYLCESPILDASIIRIISEHKNFESARTGLIEYKQNN